MGIVGFPVLNVSYWEVETKTSVSGVIWGGLASVTGNNELAMGLICMMLFRAEGNKAEGPSWWKLMLISFSPQSAEAICIVFGRARFLRALFFSPPN